MDVTANHPLSFAKPPAEQKVHERAKKATAHRVKCVPLVASVPKSP